MNVHVTGRRDDQAQADTTAPKSLVQFPVLHLVYKVAIPFFVSSKYSPADLPRVIVSDAFIAVYHSLHSIQLSMWIPRVNALREACGRQYVLKELGTQELEGDGKVRI